ncbi:hypothetical protein MNV49_001589 [Pseudohyphozyma bogoriensis]|nr:hypothetical protein MNV49_001589 [Pseudohyphozyma bogoriensis]
MKSFGPAIPTMSLGHGAAGYTMEAKLQAAAKAGFVGIEMFYPCLEAFSLTLEGATPRDKLRKAAAESKRIAEGLGLDIFVLQPVLNYDGIKDPKEHEERVEEIRFRFELCHLLGCDIMQVPANFRLDDGITGDEAKIVADLQEIADWGAKESPPIRFVYEAMCWSTFNSTWQRGWNIVQKIDRPNFGYVLDAFHIGGLEYADPTLPGGVRPDAEANLQQSLDELVRTIPGDRVFYIQLVDAERLDIPLAPLGSPEGSSKSPYYLHGQAPRMSWSRNYEEARGAHMPIEKICKAFVDTGFKGWVSFELFNRFMSVPAEETPDLPTEHAERGFKSWLTLKQNLNLQTDESQHLPKQPGQHHFHLPKHWHPAHRHCPPIESTPPKPTPFDDVQGDVIIGLQKRVQAFIFFSVTEVDAFRHILKHKIAPKVATTVTVQEAAQRIAAARSGGSRVWLPLTLFNVAFTAVGVKKLLGVDDDKMQENFPGATAFLAGQQADAVKNLADTLKTDQTLANWKDEYLGRKIDGVLLVTAEKLSALEREINELLEIIGKSVHVVKRVNGTVRPGAEEGHEHFGYLDGISHPTLIGFNDKTGAPGETAIDPSVVLTGLTAPTLSTGTGTGTGSSGTSTSTPPAPSWLKNGSFLVFRELQQLVPEFNSFVATSAVEFQKDLPGITADAVGARIVGRWKSGAPVVLAPTEDNPVLGGDPERNQHFDYGDDLEQVKCPYAAHLRKTNPRKGTNNPVIAVAPHLFIRAGIPYGPEVTVHERENNKSDPHHERGLLFVSYQSSIEAGFQFVQKSWSNNPAFPFGNKANITTPGSDLIIGQTNTGGARSANGIKPEGNTDQNNNLSAPAEFVVSRGGEYFFVPSIEALKTKIGA